MPVGVIACYQEKMANICTYPHIQVQLLDNVHQQALQAIPCPLPQGSA